MPSTETKRTACPLDCPDACQLEVEVDGGRVARVAARSGAGNPLTEGYLCGKVRRIARHLECPERVGRPLLRVGAKGAGEFREVGWDEALDRVEAGIREAIAAGGSEAVLPVCYGGSNGLLTQDATDALFFRRLGAARCLRTLCAMPSGAALGALYGKMPGVVYPDFGHAKLIVVWGQNPHHSGIHAVPFVKRARDAGAKLIVVDPRRISLAKDADLHLALVPGSDLPLALCVAGELFRSGRADRAFLAEHATGVASFEAAAREWTVERAADACGLEAADIERFVELFAGTRPAVLRMGWGQERSRSGGFASAAILALPAVAGHFGVRGGGYTASHSGAWNRELRPGVDAPDRARREVNLNRLGIELTAPEDTPIRAAFVYNCNPVSTCPNQNSVRAGFEREDLFTVVFDAVLTDTARYADVVLPATTFLEHHDVARSYGVPVLLDGPPAVPAMGEARSNSQVFGELARRFDLVRDEGELDGTVQLERMLGGADGGAARRRDLEQRGVLEAPIGTRPVPFVDVFPGTPDGKVHLWPGELARAEGVEPYAWRPDPATREAPLALISPATSRTISSTFAQLVGGTEPLFMHPTDARTRGLGHGDVVRVFNARGEMRVPLALDEDLRPGVVCFAKGMWARHTLDGNTSNALVPDDLTDLGGGACFNDARVEVERA